MFGEDVRIPNEADVRIPNEADYLAVYASSDGKSTFNLWTVDKTTEQCKQ